MKLRVFTLPVLMSAMLVLALSGCGKSPEQHLQAGKALFEKSDYKAAILELKSTLQEQPGNREARLLLGKAYLANDAYADAEKELTKAREQGASYDEVLPALARSLLKQNQGQKVLELTIPSSSLTPQSVASLHVSRAEAFMTLGKRNEAEQAILLAGQADAQLPELHLFSAKLALVDQNKPEALRFIGLALQKDPKLSEALYLKADLLRQDKKDEEAIQNYRQIIANDARHIRAYLAISEIQMLAGKVEDADKTLQLVEKVAPNATIVKFRRGMFELRRGKLKEANDALQQVLKVAPDHMPSVLAQAMVSYELGNFEQSFRNGQRVLSQDPKSPIASRLVAASQLKTGDGKAALATLEPLLKSGVEDAQLFGLAAEIYTQLKEFNKAISYLDRALALDRNNPALVTQQALIRLQSGDDKKALLDLEKAVSLGDKSGKADLALIILQIQRKQFDAALQAIAVLEKKQPKNPVPHNLRAAALIGKQDTLGARKELEQALAIQPTFVPAATGLARLDMADKNLPSARKRFETILAQDKNNLQAMLSLAELAMSEKQENEYVKWLENAVNSHPAAIKPAELLTRYYIANNNSAKAMEIVRQLLKANPESPQALSLLGAVQAWAGSKSESIASFNALVDKNKNSPKAYLQLAVAQISAKQFEQARTNLTRALQLEPNYVDAQDLLIQLELSEKAPDAALKVANIMKQQYPKSSIGLDREGNIYLHQKRYPQAIKAYEQALAKQATSQGLIKLYRVLVVSGEIKGADKRLNDWLVLNPKDLIVRQYAAQVYTSTNRNSEAISQYESILKVTPNDPVALNNLASLYQKIKDPRALATAEQGYKLSSNNPGVMDTLGWILLESGQNERAANLLRQAVEKAPNVGVHRYHLAVALIKSGDKANAKKELEAAIATSQKFPELESARAMLKTL